MQIKASASHLPITPRKVQLVAFAVKQMKPQEAVTVLSYLNKNAASYLMKVIKQAIANAQNNYHLSPDTLKFDQIIVTKGITLKRFNAGARGRGKPVQKIRSHITVILKSPSPSSSKDTIVRDPSKLQQSRATTPKKVAAKTKTTTKKVTKISSKK